VLIAFIWGCIRDDGFGWAFLPTMVLTAPWSFGVIHRPNALVSMIEPFHDAPLFLIAAAINISIAYLLKKRMG
jgi:hypothetical protein